MKRCATSPIIQEMPIKTTMRSPHTCQNGYDKKKDRRLQVLTRVWRKRNPWVLLVGMQTGAATMENTMEVPQKIKNRTTTQPRNSISGYLSEAKIITQKDVCIPHVHCSIIYNTQDVETT